MAAVDDHHRSVLEVAHTLVGFLAVADHLDAELIARLHLGPQRDYQFAEVHHLQLLHFAHLGEVVISREQGAAGVRRQLEQLVVDPIALVAGGVDHQAPAVALAQVAEELEAAASLAALLGVRGVRQGLQLIDDRLGDDHLSFQQS